MNYDIWGSWSLTVGPNAPLNDTCAAPQNQAGSAVSAVQKWSKAGIPLEKIVLGVASYGHSFRVHKANAFVSGSSTLIAPYPKFDAKNPPRGDSWAGTAGVDVCGKAQPASDVINFWGLIQLGYLNPNGTLKKGIFFRYDNCSQTVSFFYLHLIYPVFHRLLASRMCITPRLKLWCRMTMPQ